jgi:uncharacterized surface protein with fasciclin (FAS1) repeats
MSDSDHDPRLPAPGVPILPDPPAEPSRSDLPTQPASPGFEAPAADPPAAEPIFIAEQTPVPPGPGPVVPATTQMPTVPTGATGAPTGVPVGGEPTSVMPPVAAGAVPPGGPRGPMGPDADEPEVPWYKKPGPILVAVIVAALLVALLVWLFTSGGDDDDSDEIVIVSVESTLPPTSIVDATTTPPISETTAEVATTAAPDTTIAPDTTAVPETTIAATTTEAPATTTTTIPEIIPEPGETVWDVIEREPELSELQRLMELAGLQSSLQDPGSTYTLFAPTNDAITTAFEDLGDPEDLDETVLQNILLAHLNNADAIQQAELVTLTQVPVVFGGPQQVDGGATPPTIGGARILVQAAPTVNGIIYAIDRVLQPVAD